MLNDVVGVTQLLKDHAYLISLTAIVVTVTLWWIRERNERRLIEIYTESEKVFDSSNPRRKGISPIWTEFPEVAEVWLHIIRITNIGRKDMAESEMDKDKGPIRVTTESDILDILPQNNLHELDLIERTNRRLQIGLGLFKTSELIVIKILTTGSARPNVEVRAKDFRTVTRDGETIRVKQRRAHQATLKTTLFMTVFSVTYVVSTVSGLYLVEKSRTIANQASAKSRRALQLEREAQRRLDVISSSGSLEQWAKAHGYKSVDQNDISNIVEIDPSR